MVLQSHGTPACSVESGMPSTRARVRTLSSLRPVGIGENSFVFASDGSLLGSIPSSRNRQPLKLGEMTRWIPKATVAIEDRRFYEHGGLDYRGILRAAVTDIQSTLAVGEMLRHMTTIALFRSLTGGADGIIVAFDGTMFGLNAADFADPATFWIIVWCTVWSLAALLLTRSTSSGVRRARA